jgi:succinyl-CoA synthetase beta subunit
MNTHEYQAKIILRQYGIPIPDFAVVSDIDEVRHAINEMNLSEAVVKIQVHAGGRGKAGGVKLAKSREEIVGTAKKLLHMKMVNKQTGPAGVVAHQLLLTPITQYKKEYYLGAVIDRHLGKAILIASPEGGMEIEEVAAKHPEQILKVPIPLNGCLRHYQLWQIFKFMGWQNRDAGMQLAKALAQAFIETDASLLEINPLVETEAGELIALDAKLSVDENALFRQQRIAEFYDSTQISQYESDAKKHDLAYVAMDGDIGCMVNGAGLAMATMDLIFLHGGSPANFLDVGGGATQEKVAEGFKILLSDPKVKAIFVNIFGGIMNCVTLAAGIVSAASELKVCVPLVVRMEGTNVENGRKILEDSGLNIINVDDLTEAAKTVVKLAKEGGK